MAHGQCIAATCPNGVPLACSCEVIFDGGPLVDAFRVARQDCVVLRELLAPDDAWEQIVRHAHGAHDPALHCSYLLAAFQRSHLQRITRPIHELLANGSSLKPELTRQYRVDLAETWLSARDPVQRHERFRRFFGKVVELQVAAWLAAAGWTISELEALGAQADIVAEREGSGRWHVDVKYIGQHTGDFVEIVASLAGDGISVGPKSLYGSINYLLFRVFEGARSLARANGRGFVVVVIDDLAWPTFDVPVVNRWIDWDKPAFIQTDETEWNVFLVEQRTKTRNLDSLVRDHVSQLDGLLVLRLADHKYSIAFEHGRRLTTKWSRRA